MLDSPKYDMRILKTNISGFCLETFSAISDYRGASYLRCRYKAYLLVFCILFTCDTQALNYFFCNLWNTTSPFWGLVPISLHIIT